ncbi:hypothetical protein Tco_1215547 [Tanacetum coccineum]
MYQIHKRCFEDEVKDDSDEELLEAGEEMDEEFIQSAHEQTQQAHYTETPIEEPISQEHQSPSPHKEQPESSKDKKTDASDSESSLCSETLKPYSERKLGKHKEAATSYVDLRVAVEGFVAEADNNRNTYDIAINSVMGTVEQINGARVKEKATLLKALNIVSKTLEADSILKASMQKMAKTNITTCGNITDLTEILRNAKLPEIITYLQAINFPSFQDRIIAIENTHVTMQADISSIKGMGEQLSIVDTTKEPEVEKEPDVENVENELECEPQDIEPIPITIIRPPDKGKGIARDTVKSPPNHIKASTKDHLDLDTPVLVPYEIYRKMYLLTEEQIQVHSNKEEKLEKAAREARLNKPELIKVVHEMAKLELTQKIFRSQRVDELKDIIPKKKNKVVEDLMNSLRKKYESLRETLDELGITSILPAFVQVLSLTSGRKRKHQELKLEVRILRLECNRNLLEGISFVNNLVIEYLENGIFFIDVFGDEDFQRINDIHKVDVETLLTYLVMGSNISTPANQRFCTSLRSLIDSHPKKEKLKSKKVKLEAIGYSLN